MCKITNWIQKVSFNSNKSLEQGLFCIHFLKPLLDHKIVLLAWPETWPDLGTGSEISILQAKCIAEHNIATQPPSDPASHWSSAASDWPALNRICIQEGRQTTALGKLWNEVVLTIEDLTRNHFSLDQDLSQSWKSGIISSRDFSQKKNILNKFLWRKWSVIIISDKYTKQENGRGWQKVMMTEINVLKITLKSAESSSSRTTPSRAWGSSLRSGPSWSSRMNRGAT